jgi:hypothetical protein
MKTAYIMPNKPHANVLPGGPETQAINNNCMVLTRSTLPKPARMAEVNKMIGAYVAPLFRRHCRYRRPSERELRQG